MAKNTAVALFADAENLPAHIKADANLGNENVNSEDLQRPQIKLLQKMSPQVDSIEGAKPGLFINTLDNKLSEELTVINCHYVLQHTIFQNRNHGGKGIPLGTFPTEQEAIAYLSNNDLDATKFDIVKSGRHVLMVLDEEGHKETEALMYMSNTGFAQSQNWNSQISSKPGSRFAGAWKVTAKHKQNDKGSWFVPEFDFLGWADEILYAQAKALYEAIEASNG